MKTNLEGMFQKVPFEEAYKTTMKHNKRISDYKARNAVLNGNLPLDQEYTAFAKQAAEYQLQFTSNELFALMERADQEAK
ncbi:MAG: hypothetical protein AABX27_00500 [Nanoarchaeota archaeon]